MAAISSRSVIPHNPQWTPSEMTFGALYGMRGLRVPEQLIHHNNSNSPHPLPWRNAFVISAHLYFTLEDADSILSYMARNGNPAVLFFDKYYSAFFIATAALISVNAYTVLTDQTNKNVSDVSSQFDKFAVTVWKATPYLMLVSRLAINMLYIPYNKVFGLVSLAAAGFKWE